LRRERNRYEKKQGKGAGHNFNDLITVGESEVPYGLLRSDKRATQKKNRKGERAWWLHRPGGGQREFFRKIRNCGKRYSGKIHGMHGDVRRIISSKKKNHTYERKTRGNWENPGAPRGKESKPTWGGRRIVAPRPAEGVFKGKKPKGREITQTFSKEKIKKNKGVGGSKRGCDHLSQTPTGGSKEIVATKRGCEDFLEP